MIIVKPQITSYQVAARDAGLRLDLFLAQELPSLSRSHIQKLSRENLATVNGVPARPSQRLQPGDIVTLTIPAAQSLRIDPEPIPLDIIYEDSWLIAVNKPRGMVVHPAAGNYHGTLVNALLYHCSDLSGINGILRPGIVHRLDKDTSGLLLVAKNNVAHLNLVSQFREHRIVKKYTALVHGTLGESHGTVNAPIGRHPRDRQKMAIIPTGRSAVTHYRVITTFPAYSLLDIRLETGRTHQIRVHMSHIGHPIVGDLKYGHARVELGLSGQFLHASRLQFVHPISGLPMDFQAPLPEELQDVLKRLSA